jgi:hypothetical protein
MQMGMPAEPELGPEREERSFLLETLFPPAAFLLLFENIGLTLR